jgi:hypothetical protein
LQETGTGVREGVRQRVGGIGAVGDGDGSGGGLRGEKRGGVWERERDGSGRSSIVDQRQPVEKRRGERA